MFKRFELKKRKNHSKRPRVFNTSNLDDAWGNMIQEHRWATFVWLCFVSEFVLSLLFTCDVNLVKKAVKAPNIIPMMSEPRLSHKNTTTPIPICNRNNCNLNYLFIIWTKNPLFWLTDLVLWAKNYCGHCKQVQKGLHLESSSDISEAEK